MQRLITSIILAAFVLHPGVSTMASTALTYQGRLDAGGQAFDGSVDMVFELFDAEAGGTAVGSPIAINGVAVQQGLFQVELDFGAQAWEMGRWLQITVEGQPLTPRQKVTGAPLAWRAETVVEEAVGSQELEDGGVQGLDIADDSIFSNHIVDGAVGASEIAEESVSSMHLAAGLYRSKTDLYVVENSVDVSAGRVLVEVACNDTNDLPINWECDGGPTNSGLHLMSARHANWSTLDGAATTRCVADYDNGVGTYTLTARIYCVAVP